MRLAYVGCCLAAPERTAAWRKLEPPPAMLTTATVKNIAPTIAGVLSCHPHVSQIVSVHIATTTPRTHGFLSVREARRRLSRASALVGNHRCFSDPPVRPSIFTEQAWQHVVLDSAQLPDSVVGVIAGCLAASVVPVVVALRLPAARCGLVSKRVGHVIFVASNDPRSHRTRRIVVMSRIMGDTDVAGHR
jgi:hypothetical protein